MKRIPRSRNTKEVREEAINLAKAVGASEASRRLSIRLKTLVNWERTPSTTGVASRGNCFAAIPTYH
ncbi:hypothetical protein ACFQUU_28285 [Herbaspirillum sp. GCM10030257]|uniref:hypothetical protein n=1 Tax=Herbaspirillum sp. GCM10030257 TaxID=3273393 RepID=UPI00360CD716